MSTTFAVYPQSPTIPSFGELIDLARFRLLEQLHRRGVAANPVLDVLLRKASSHKLLSLDLRSPLMWNDDEYAWFYVPGVAGGTDAYCMRIDDFIVEYWTEILDYNEKARSQRSLIQACLANGHYWYFRRSVGQPAIINFAYGILAASLAELTGGIIDSYDCAWESKRLPATAAEVYELYFVPSRAISSEEADWAQECLAAIPDELRA